MNLKIKITFIYIIKENHFLQVVDEFSIDLNIILWYNEKRKPLPSSSGWIFYWCRNSLTGKINGSNPFVLGSNPSSYAIFL